MRIRAAEKPKDVVIATETCDRNVEHIWLAMIQNLKLIHVYLLTGYMLDIALCTENSSSREGTKHKYASWLRSVDEYKMNSQCIIAQSRIKQILNHLTPGDPNINVECSQFVQCMQLDHGKMASILYNWTTNKTLNGNLGGNIPLTILKYLNGKGHIWGRHTNTLEYKKHVGNHYRNLLKIEQMLLETPFGSKNAFQYEYDAQIPFSHINDPTIQNNLQSAYDIQVYWVPGFYSRKNLPLFSGGVSYETQDNNLTFIQLNPYLLEREKLGTLDRRELIMHELIHSARMGLDSVQFEEEFAYSLSTSTLRRIFAPITQRPIDSILFSVFSIFSITTDLPRFPRWLSLLSKFPFAIVVFIGMLRLLRTRRALKAAHRHLESLGCIPRRNIRPFLFRLTDDEILELSRKSICSVDEFRHIINSKAKHSSRWLILQQYLHPVD